MVLGNISVHKVNHLSLISFFAITCISFFKVALELEDAEQAYYSQWLRWGYDDQPPLFTWLQFGINQLLGIHKVSFSLFRGLIFASILLLLYQFARKMVKDGKKAELAIFGLALIPVFIDFTFRRLSHTSLLCASVIASYMVLQRLVHQKTWGDYALFGLVAGIGALSKYNYVFFLAALGLTLFFDASMRRVIFHKKIALTLLLVAVLLFPHFHWLMAPDGYLAVIRGSIRLKMENEPGNTISAIDPLFSLLLNLIRMIAPLLVVVTLAFVLGKARLERLKIDWFVKLALGQFAVLVLFFVVMGVQRVEERWLLPLVLPFIVLLVRSVEFKSAKKWSTYGFALFLTVIGFQVLRTPAEKILGIGSSVHFGFGPLNDVLQKNHGNKKWMLPNVTYGGNIRLLNPKREVFTKDDFSLPKSKLCDFDGIEVVIGKEQVKGKRVFDSILDFGKERNTLFIIDFEGDMDARSTN
ncbi:MAG: hypothetical protein CR994_05360 [Maribacter sp.]|nr:MAG: hypothetical protein CR994_05360 [Maribacter sp.]